MVQVQGFHTTSDIHEYVSSIHRNALACFALNQTWLIIMIGPLKEVQYSFSYLAERRAKKKEGKPNQSRFFLGTLFSWRLFLLFEKLKYSSAHLVINGELFIRQTHTAAADICMYWSEFLSSLLFSHTPALSSYSSFKGFLLPLFYYVRHSLFF